MHKIGDIISYKAQGLCKIQAIKKEDMGQGEKEYYLLSPLNDEKSLIHIPCDNTLLCEKIKTLLTTEEVKELINAFKDLCCEWIANDRHRTEVFKSVIDSGNRLELMKLWKSVDARESELLPLGKKIRSSDEYLREQAKKLLISEFSFVLGTEFEKTEEYIKNNQ